MTLEKKSSFKFVFKKTYLIGLIVLFCLISLGSFYYLNNKFSKKIEYTDNSKSVLENFRTDQNNIPINKNASSDTLVLALMEFQNQSKNLTQNDVDEISLLFKNKFSDSEKILTVQTPQGSENLNPPEVMLIATESNASFVVNGIVYDENDSSFINVKIYEAKRGSLIVNQKLNLKDNSKELVEFTSDFMKDVLKK